MCLLTVLWTLGRSAASQAQPPAGAETALQPDQLLKLIVHDITATIQSMVSRLSSRIDGIHTRLNNIEDRLNALDSKQDSFDAGLDGLTSRMDSVDNSLISRLDELASRVNELTTERGRLDNISSRLDELATRTDQDLSDQDVPDMPPRDCSELPAGTQSGIYRIQPGTDRSQPPVAAYCDLDNDGGGWTVIQRRADILPRQDFNLDWSAYREGFGQLDAEFWWGLEKLWRLTGPQDRQYELRVNLADFDGGRRHATYREFGVTSEAHGYRLLLTNYTGDAGDSFGLHNDQKFSTKDREQDTDYDRHCARVFKAGWWFRNCYFSNLNGQYLSGQHGKKLSGVHWGHWRGYEYSLKDVEIKVRPVVTG